MNNNSYSGKNYIQIVNNSEKYIEQLMTRHKISIDQKDILTSSNLRETDDPLLGYYPVKSFIINENDIYTETLFSKYNIYCGDCFRGECYLLAIKKLNNN